MKVKRFTDIVFSIFGLVLLSPVFLIVAIWIKLDSMGPVFFRQERVGKCGKLFRIYKFRTMVPDAEDHGPQVTSSIDRRVTKVGGFLRKYKIDELPQLVNVMVGDMSLVGPRPEVPKYVAYYPAVMKDLVLSIPPGITDNASIIFRKENELLSKTSDPETYYIENLLPRKLEIYADYVRHRNMLGDMKLIFETLFKIHR